ncbi:hypothetical protein HZA42_00615 [Candidatus Peregrinibacteria bacterium]|nr:hypothetical protein [Candidatus Peregrinibacteria bacterium]
MQGAKAGVGLAWKGTKTAAWYGVRGENIKNWAKWNVEAFKAWRNKTGYGPVMEKKMVRNWKTGEMEEKWVAKRYTEGPKKGMVVMGEVPARFGGLQKWFHERAVTDAFSAKRLRRMTDFNKNREDLLQARVSANPSHGLFMVEWETKGLVKKGVPMDIARFEKGEIKAEKARSEGKTGRYEAMGQKAVATQKRYKIKKDDKTGRLIIGFEDEGTGGTLNEQMAEHEIEKEAYEASLAAGKAEARLKYAEKVTGEGEKPGREALELASDMKKEAETAKIREDLIKEGIEIAESKEAKEEFVQKGEQEAKLDETLISEAAKKLSGVIKTLDADIEARQEEVIGNIIKEEIKAEDQFSIDKKEAKGAIEKFGEKKKILLETDAKMKEWADIRDGARSEVESKENEIATAKEDLGKEKDPKKQAGVREKIEQLKQDLAEKEAILAGIEKDKPVELGTLEDPIEKAGKRLKEIEREQKMSQIKFGVEKEKSISGDEVLRSKKAEREGKAKKLEEEEKEYQKTDKYKTGAAEVRLKKIYIEGGEEALSRELKNSEPALGEEELRQVVRFKREEYDSAGYTGGFQTVEARKMASTFAIEKEKSALKALEAEAKEKALGVSGIRSLFEEAQVGQILAEAADKFVERIKQVDLEKIFKTGLSDMAKETKINKTIKEQEIKAIKATGAEQERLRAETAKLRTEIQRLHLTAGARMARGETAANYAKEATTIVRQELVDNADSEYSRERYGFDTPATAYKALIKKKMEDYSGVEREQSIRQSFDSLGKLLRLTTKGEDAGRDQTAMAMAGITYLTKQAWSDDLLNLIVDQIQAGAQGKLTGEEREVAEVMKSVFIDKFGWGKVKEDGTINIVSESSNRWTNDLHRLLGRAGNVDNLMAENASLRVMDQTGNGMSAVNEVIVERLRAKAKGSGVDVKEKGWEKQLRSKLGEEEYDEFSKSLGFDGEKAKKELEALARTFVTGTSSVGEAVENFKDSLKRDFEALQMLADAKNAAMSVAHLDDGGHTIYDVNEGVFRGQTAENAMKFILSDWRKIGADERIRRLKIHSVAQMNEHTGTIRIDERNLQAIEETFAGTDTELIFNKSDGRNVDQISGLAAGEKAIIDSKTGRMVLGDENSKMVAETFGHIADAKERQAAALQQIADNCASMLTSSGSTVFLTASLGKRSNLAYVESTQGQFNLQLPDGKTITTTEEFLKFVEEHRSKENKNTVHINRAQVLRTFQSKQKQFGKGPDKQKKKQKEDEDVDE